MPLGQEAVVREAGLPAARCRLEAPFERGLVLAPSCSEAQLWKHPQRGDRDGKIERVESNR